jgi:carbamoyl-phosphate synthase large subunit
LPQILILSAGRRFSLIRSFKDAAAKHGILTIAGDARPDMSSACYQADKRILLPHVRAEDYAAALIEYCAENDVRLVVPTIDTEVLRLSELREDLRGVGTEAVVCDPSLARICRDKRLTSEFFAVRGLQSPIMYPRDEIAYPCLVKPYDGSLSSGIAILRSSDDVTAALLDNPKNIFCEYLEPSQYEEFTCDAYFDRHSQLRCVVPRLRIEVRGGEVAKARTQKNDIVPFLFDRLHNLEGAKGCLTIQIMKHRETGAMFLLEINPRFGGGYPLTAQSGAAYHEWLIDEYVFGRDIPLFQGWTDRLLMLRYDDAVFVAE